MKIEIEIADAKKLYKSTPEWFQEKLRESFGEKPFLPRNYQDIKTFEDACEDQDIAPYSIIPEACDWPKDEIAYLKLKVIIRAINQGWEPDWDDSSQKKWWPWFRLSSGFGFDNSYFNYVNTYTNVGSRLCFESKEKSDYAAKQFQEIYKDFLT